MGGLFDSKKTTVSQEPMMPDWQLATGKQLSEWIQQFMKNYAPGEAYTGKLSADMTGQEKTGLGLLDKYLTSGPGDLFRSGKQQILDTLSGKFANAETSPYIQAMKTLNAQDLQDAINASRRGTGARGKFFSTASLGEEGDLTGRSLANLNSVIGNFLQNERQNQLGAATTAQGMDTYENMTLPLSKISSSQTFGSLQRTLEQADLERQYTAWQNQRKEMSKPIESAQSLYGTSVPYGIKSLTTEAPSTFMKMLGEVIPGVGSYNTQKYGYDVNQSSIKEAIDAIMKAMGSGAI